MFQKSIAFKYGVFGISDVRNKTRTKTVRKLTAPTAVLEMEAPAFIQTGSQDATTSPKVGKKYRKTQELTDLFIFSLKLW